MALYISTQVPTTGMQETPTEPPQLRPLNVQPLSVFSCSSASTSKYGDVAVAMKLIFTKDCPLNTTLVDETSGAVVYEIETEKSRFSRKPTIIRKPATSQRGQPAPRSSTEVASIQWKAWSSDLIVFDGHEMKREEFLPKVGTFSDGFLITVNGTKYRWKTSNSLPKLVTNDRKKELVAKLHEAHHVFGRRKGFLEVAPAGVTMLDQIVVSLVYVESKRRETVESTAVATTLASSSVPSTTT